MVVRLKVMSVIFLCSYSRCGGQKELQAGCFAGNEDGKTNDEDCKTRNKDDKTCNKDDGRKADDRNCETGNGA